MILMYHKVDVITPTTWWVTPGDLSRHLEALKHRQFVYLDDYDSPDQQVVVTFDDAYENVYRHALPVLVSHGVPFEVFVIGARIGGWNWFDEGEPLTRHMDWPHLAAIAALGGRLQWHSQTHPALPELGDADLARELTVPTALTSKFAPPHFQWLSYPGGAHDDRVVNETRRRFSGAVSVLDGRPDDRFQLNRVTVDRHTAISRHDMDHVLRGTGVPRGK